jgi:hypothetical protein
MSKEVKEMTQDEMSKELNNLIIKRFIKKGNANLKPKKVKEKLGFDITKDALNDVIRSVRGILIGNEITAQGDDDSLEYIEKVSKKIVKFDFTKYEDMPIEELRTYLMVHNSKTGENIEGKNFIKKSVERSCVGVYSLLKGGTVIE